MTTAPVIGKIDYFFESPIDLLEGDIFHLISYLQLTTNWTFDHVFRM